jgi:hypothetical protein
MFTIEQATFGSLNALWNSCTETADSNGNLATTDFTVSFVHCSSWLLLSFWHWFGGQGVHLTSAAYKITLNVGLSETCFLIKMKLFTWGNLAPNFSATRYSSLDR